MKVIVRPKGEKEVLVSTTKAATPEEIREKLLVHSDGCVQPRCGCGTCK